MPTETVYGLGADADNATAVASIFAAKGRPADHPLIVHVAAQDGGRSGVAHFAATVPAFAQKLMAAFWPGPLTLILPRRHDVAAAAAGGQNSIDCTRGVPVLLRPGSISRTQVEAACGCRLLSNEELLAQGTQGLEAKKAPKASGTLESHYAPNATVRLMDAKALQTALKLLDGTLEPVKSAAPTIAVYARTALKNMPRTVVLRAMPRDAAAAAHELFAALRAFDDQGVKLIWVETPPDTPEWEGVRDRLQRASA